MRRKDKEIADPQKIEAVLNQAQIIHIAMLDGERPYIIPLNFGYAENTIYTLTLHKFLSSSLAVMSEIVAFSGQMLDA
ncbi:hypothetical protein D1BOALGB6SA_6558 [Olavius sp. associated proteobacterium Delta 1]|nr:hypothetical protein D1BOALGB6SA_6558 [Olavius sp. associated proteobacterium Delta 1]